CRRRRLRPAPRRHAAVGPDQGWATHPAEREEAGMTYAHTSSNQMPLKRWMSPLSRKRIQQVWMPMLYGRTLSHSGKATTMHLRRGLTVDSPTICPTAPGFGSFE